MNKTEGRYYAKEFAPGKWHVIDRQSGIPVYNGDDKPLVISNDDAAFDCVERINQTYSQTEK